MALLCIRNPPADGIDEMAAGSRVGEGASGDDVDQARGLPEEQVAHLAFFRVVQ